MGVQISDDRFAERDYARVRERLEQCLSELGRLLERPGFGVGPVTIGAELECFLVDGAALPLPRNTEVRAALADPRVTLELNRFNLELNASPVPLAGPDSRPFTALGGELDLLLGRAGHAARAHAGRIALIGILPTLSEAHLQPGVMTDAAGPLSCSQRASGCTSRCCPRWPPPGPGTPPDGSRRRWMS